MQTNRAPSDPGAKLPKDHPLNPVIADAYRVFAVAKPRDLGVCDCCMESDIQSNFTQPKIASLPLHYVQDWYFAASDPEIPQATWTWLLPRVMEIVASGEEPAHVGIEVTLGRFPTGDASRWSDEQWRVIDRFQRELLIQPTALSKQMLDDVLCMLASGGWQLDELLDQVWDWPDTVLVERLWEDWCSWGRFHSIWQTAFWDSPEKERVMAWYTNERLANRLLLIGTDDTLSAELRDKALDIATLVEDSRR